MGIHYVFGYVGYETAFAETLCHLLESYCFGCHTNEDVNKECKNCPIGNLVYASKDYVMSAYESKILKDDTIALRKIKKYLKNINPCPFIWLNKEEGYKKLKLAISELKAIEKERLDWFRIEERRRNQISKMIEIENEKRKGLRK